MKFFSLLSPLIFFFALFSFSSAAAPTGIVLEQLPQFVVIGSDDNNSSMEEILRIAEGRGNPIGNSFSATHDGEAISFSFYTNGIYLGYQTTVHQQAVAAGHELGNHTYAHVDLTSLAADKVFSEISQTDSLYVAGGFDTSKVTGIRAPFLGINDSVLQVIHSYGKRYDCSLELGYQTATPQGENMPWPFLLDNGASEVGISGSYPGLWEVPAYPVIVPHDSLAGNLNFDSGLRNRISLKLGGDFDIANGLLTGLDYNILFSAAMDSVEYLATLKNTLDQRLRGNRAPFAFGIHSAYYGSGNSYGVKGGSWVLENFLDYALSKPEVRVISASRLLDWMESPRGLDGSGGSGGSTSRLAVENGISQSEFRVEQGQVVVTTPSEWELSIHDLRGRLVLQQQGNGRTVLSLDALDQRPYLIHLKAEGQ